MNNLLSNISLSRIHTLFNMVRLEVEMISTFMIYNDKKPVNNSSSWFDNFILSLLSSKSILFAFHLICEYRMVPEMKLYTVSLYTLYFNYAIQILTIKYLTFINVGTVQHL
jgi:hypothetical protein